MLFIKPGQNAKTLYNILWALPVAAVIIFWLFSSSEDRNSRYDRLDIAKTRQALDYCSIAGIEAGGNKIMLNDCSQFVDQRRFYYDVDRDRYCATSRQKKDIRCFALGEMTNIFYNVKNLLKTKHDFDTWVKEVRERGTTL